MAQGKDRIRSTYPLPSYNYRVTVLNGEHAVVIGCSKVSGLTQEYEPVIYRDGLSFAAGFSIIPGLAQPLRLRLEQGLVKGSDFLARWLAQSHAAPFAEGARRDLLIDLCDETGAAVVRWSVGGAMPVKIEAPTLAADSNEVAIAAVELIARTLRVEYH